MRLVAIALIAGCSGMPDVSSNPLGESGHANLSVSPDKTSVNALGLDLVVRNDGDGASGAIGARLVDHDAGAFAITRSDCSELQPGGSCAIGVVFAPQGTATTGMTTLEIDDDNQPETSAELDGKLEPAIRWQETAAPMSAQDCTVAGASETISTTIHLLYSGIAVGGVQITSSDSHYTIVNGCIGALGTTGKCDVIIQVRRGDQSSTPPSPAKITAAIGGLSATIATVYQLQACDLVLDPDPLVLDAMTTSGMITLTNRSGINSHILASTLFGPNPTLSLPENTCKQGLVLAPMDTCVARVVYTPSANPQNDGGSASYTITTGDASPLEPLAVTGSIQINLANNHIHFEKNTYSWDDVTTGSPGVPMAMKVLTDAGVASAGPLTVSLSNPNAWTIDNGTIGTCAAPFTAGCTFSVDFVATQVPGNYSGVIVAKGTSGEVAFALLKAKVN